VVLNIVLLFGFGPIPSLGIVGVALGTVIANFSAGLIFFVLLLSGRYAVSLRADGRHLDLGLIKEILRIGIPLSGLRLLDTFGRFPFLFVLGTLGTPAVAAYAIGRRVMQFALMPAWGYATAASTLVGQAVGAGDNRCATDYGWQTLRIGLVTQLLFTVILVLGARWIAVAFGTENVDLTVTFIRVFGVIVAGFSISRTMHGSLRGAGDIRWPVYGTVIGTFGFRIPIAALALPTGFVVTVLGTTLPVGMGLGFPAVFLAMIADFYTRAAVNTVRFWSKKWQVVARKSGVGAVSADDD